MSYESDLYAWTKEQADALRRRASNALDWDNLAEEIEILGTSNLDQIESPVENLDSSPTEMEISAGIAVRELARIDL